MSPVKRIERYKQLMRKARRMEQLVRYYDEGHPKHQNNTAIKTFAMWRDHALQGASIHRKKMDRA